MLNNERNGLGVEVYEDSNFYVGNFLDNKRSGQGKMLWAVKSKESKDLGFQYYNGEWKDGEPHGYGYHFTEHSIYVGHFKNGTKNGKGV